MGLFVGYIGKGTPDLGLGLSARALLAGYNVSALRPGSVADVQRHRSPVRVKMLNI